MVHKTKPEHLGDLASIDIDRLFQEINKYIPSELARDLSYVAPGLVDYCNSCRAFADSQLNVRP